MVPLRHSSYPEQLLLAMAGGRIPTNPFLIGRLTDWRGNEFSSNSDAQEGPYLNQNAVA